MLNNMVDNIEPVGSKTLFNAVFIRPEQVVRFRPCSSADNSLCVGGFYRVLYLMQPCSFNLGRISRLRKALKYKPLSYIYQLDSLQHEDKSTKNSKKKPRFFT